MFDRKPYILLNLKRAYDLNLITCDNNDLVDRWCPSVAPTFKFLKEIKGHIFIEFEFTEETGPIRCVEWTCQKSFSVEDAFVKELRHEALKQGLRSKIHSMKHKNSKEKL